MSTKALLEYLVTQLVDNPDEVEVTEFESKKQDTILELRVAESDTGKVVFFPQHALRPRGADAKLEHFHRLQVPHLGAQELDALRDVDAQPQHIEELRNLRIELGKRLRWHRVGRWLRARPRHR